MRTPLADLLRPASVEDVVGQHHLLDDGKILKTLIDNRQTPNMIFYGPSGVGKTTIANIIAKQSGKKLFYLNATTAGVSDIKDVIKHIGTDECKNGILLYLDEIQYFNKKQQQILLSYIENGDMSLIAATTENPFFYVYPAILSRSSVFEFKALNSADVEDALSRACFNLRSRYNVHVNIEPEYIQRLARGANGDVRKSLNMLELVLSLADNEGVLNILTVDASLENPVELTVSEVFVEQCVASCGVRYDKDGDEHYDVISAYQKALRGSDPDAALYYLGVLLTVGDLPSACRRLLVCANEDVGLAYPQIIPIVKAAVDTAMMVGLPEARLPLANAVVLVAESPKSNSTHDAINAVMQDIKRGLTGPVPRHLQNKHCDGMDNANPGQFYKYPHSYTHHYIKQQYLPDNLVGKQYYIPGDNKFEQQFDAYWKNIKK